MSAPADQLVEPRLDRRAAVYSATVVLSALLLFAVQPMIGKAILPIFGGTAAVWANCLVFFQAVLLLGYLYSHWSAQRLSPRAQLIVHLALLGASCLVLPVAAGAGWKRLAATAPAWGVFGALAASVGLPYLALSATSPLVQSWFARTASGRFPYRLYALSNLGSLLALVGYPLVVEPLAGTHTQLAWWSATYGSFVLLCAAAALLASRTHRAPVEPEAAPPAAPPSLALRAHWILLAATSSMLLVAVTNHLSQDVAPVPFLWVLPLALYLLSFVICFDHDGWYKPWLLKPLLPAAAGGLVYVLATMPPMRTAIPVAAAGAFIVFVFCHGELARRKPDPAHLTSFYVAVSIGGALGGAFVALIAPAVFTSALEFPISLALFSMLALHALYGWRSKILLALFLAAFIGVSTALMEFRVASGGRGITGRNFYGILRVSETDSKRLLYNGRIAHGMQYVDARSEDATAYYGRLSGVGRAIDHYAPGTRRIGVIGLGVATIAAYGERGDTIRFYELNPLVDQFSRAHFTYLRDSRASVEVVPGDARLTMSAESRQSYDVLAVDGFTGDAIPVHLLTREAISLYLDHLRPGGAVAVHVSNRYLDLAPLVASLARERGIEPLLLDRKAPTDSGEYSSKWVILTRNGELLAKLRDAGAQPVAPKPGLRPWTDDYSNLLRVLK